MTTAIVPSVTVDPEALAHANQVGMRAVLDHMLEATPRLIPRLRSIHVMLKPDWQYDQMNLICEVRMEPTTKEVYLAANREWNQEFLRVAPRPREHSFILKLLDEAA